MADMAIFDDLAGLGIRIIVIGRLRGYPRMAAAQESKTLAPTQARAALVQQFARRAEMVRHHIVETLALLARQRPKASRFVMPLDRLVPGDGPVRANRRFRRHDMAVPLIGVAGNAAIRRAIVVARTRPPG
jgi:hypothetical protein